MLVKTPVRLEAIPVSVARLEVISISPTPPPPLNGMLVHRRVTATSIRLTDIRFEAWVEKCNENKVSCLRTRHNVPDQGSNPDYSVAPETSGGHRSSHKNIAMSLQFV